jgi:hypothetical protein
MDISKLEEIRDKIKNSELIFFENHLYTPDQYAELTACKEQEAHYDLLQLTKKIQL